MSQIFVVEDSEPQNAIIKVMGVGGGGGNAVNHMHTSGMSEVSFLALNTDVSHLATLNVPTLALGRQRDSGLGAGTNPEVGRQAAEESVQDIESHLSQADMLFIAAGMGGGTGTGAAPVVARLARERGILTVAVVAMPFSWEKRTKVAEEGIEKLTTSVDSIIVISNDKVFEVHKDANMDDAYAKADDVLCTAVGGISDLVMKTGKINVDFADLSRIMRGSGKALIGVGEARNEVGDEAKDSNRAREAAEAAMSSPLLENVDMKGATGLLVNVTSGRDLKLKEYGEINTTVSEHAAESAQIICGWVIDDEMEGSVRVTIVVTVPHSDTEHQGHTPVTRNERGERDYSALDTPITSRSRVKLPRPPEGVPRPVAHNNSSDIVPVTDPRWTDVRAYISR